MSDIARYQLIRKIATGGMAEIYLGKQIGKDGFQRLCAIKRILPHYNSEKEYIEMFRDEAHICKRLQHGNIVRVEGFEEVEGAYAIIMEFVDGADLRALLVACEKTKKRLTVPMIVYIIAEAARGLHFAHTKADEITGKPLEIVHRDISPQNILLSYQGEIKVTDFGIADADSKMTETRPGIVKGKYSYMSPEQILGKPVDARTDVFALGIVLWEMLAMKRLFQAENEVMTINKVRNCKIPTNLPELNSDVDSDLAQITYTSLQRDPHSRYNSMEYFEKDLRRYLYKSFSDFSANDLAKKTKDIMAKKHAESAAYIRKALKQQLPQQQVRPKTQRQPKHEPDPSVELLWSSSQPKGELPKKQKDKPSSLSHDLSNSYQSMFGEQPNTSPTGVFKVRSSNVVGGFSDKSRPITGMNPAKGTQHNRIATGTAMKRLGHKGRLPTFLWVMLIFAMTAGFGGFYVRYYAKQMKAAKVQLILRTTPKLVRLKLGDEFLFDGRYRNTTRLGIAVNSGKSHKLTVIREGYLSETITFQGNPGEVIRKTDLVLTAKNRFAPVKVVLARETEHKIYFDLNEGFFVGTIPASVADLGFGKNHTMRIFPNPGNRKQFFSCRFRPRSRSWRAPFLVVVHLDEKTCSYSGT